MDATEIIHLLESNAGRIAALVGGLSEQQARWKPAPDEWSALEIVNHMLDEERLDFRLRLDTVLHRPGEQFPPNDPEAWPAAHGYLKRSLEESLADFLAERRKSLEWLKSLDAPDWDIPYSTPWREMRSGDFLVSWAMHDMLHMRQLIDVLAALTVHLAEPFDTHYAGW